MVVTAWDHIFIVIIGIVFPLYSVVSSRRPLPSVQFDFALKKNLYYSNSMILWVAVGMVWLLWWSHDRPFSTLGFKFPRWEWHAIQITLLVLILYLVDVFLELKITRRRIKTVRRWKKFTPFLPENKHEYKHFMFLAVSAGICEEIIFRGYFINYLQSLWHNSVLGLWGAVSIPAILFGVAHLYQGTNAVLKIILMAVLFGWIFILTQSLLIVIILHIFIDAAGGWLATKILGSTVGFQEEE
jgi:membrane protease YdiL (CAAX protease family)